MSEDQEKAIARERLDERIAMFVIGPVGLTVGFCAIPVLEGWQHPPITVWEKLLCYTLGVVTAFAAASGYFKVMQGRYLFTKKGDLKRFFLGGDDTRNSNELDEAKKRNLIVVGTIIIYFILTLLYFLFRTGGWLGF